MPPARPSPSTAVARRSSSACTTRAVPSGGSACRTAATACGTAGSTASGRAPATATACTDRGTRGTGTATTRPSCCSTPTPAPSTDRCASTTPCSATRPPTVTTPSATTGTPRRSCRGRSSSPTASTGRATRRRRCPGRTPWSTSCTCAGSPQQHPDVPPEQRGTYAGLAHPAVIEHLRSLGVTTVELMPVHQFVSEPFVTRRGRANYWGYNSVGFFAPHADYASGGVGRRAGRRVQVDGPRAARGRPRGRPRRRLQPHRRGRCRRADPVLARSGQLRLLPAAPRPAATRTCTGCGNTMDLRHPRCLQMVTDSLRYWVRGDARRRVPLRPRTDAGAAVGRRSTRAARSSPSSGRTRCSRRSS